MEEALGTAAVGDRAAGTVSVRMPVGWTWVVRGTAVQITRALGGVGVPTPTERHRRWRPVSAVDSRVDDRPARVAGNGRGRRFPPSVVDVGEWNALGRVAGDWIPENGRRRGSIAGDRVGVLYLSGECQSRNSLVSRSRFRLKRRRWTSTSRRFRGARDEIGHVPTAVGMLPVSDDLHALVAQLTAALSRSS